MPGRHREDDENLVVGTQDGESARALLSRATGYRMDIDTETFVVAQTLNSSYAKTTASSGSHGSQAPINVVTNEAGVRRLTPVETERLQGFPDGWTEVTADGRPVPDSHRYRLMGNAVATVCAQWLGHRLVAVDGQMRSEQAS